MLRASLANGVLSTILSKSAIVHDTLLLHD